MFTLKVLLIVGFLCAAFIAVFTDDDNNKPKGA